MANIKRIIEEYLQEQMLPRPIESGGSSNIRDMFNNDSNNAGNGDYTPVKPATIIPTITDIFTMPDTKPEYASPRPIINVNTGVLNPAPYILDGLGLNPRPFGTTSTPFSNPNR